MTAQDWLAVGVLANSVTLLLVIIEQVRNRSRMRRLAMAGLETVTVLEALHLNSIQNTMAIHSLMEGHDNA